MDNIDTSHDSPQSPAAEIRDAPQPFDDTDADIILRTGDLVDFRVYKTLLSIASPFFKAMFSLPQCPEADEIQDDETRHGLRVVPVPEDSSTLTTILLACYPRSMGRITDLKILQSSLRAAHKYEMSIFDDIDEAMIADAVQINPLAVYATACRLQMQIIADIAARAILKQPSSINQRTDELHDITAMQYYNLLQYHRDCGAASFEACCRNDWIPYLQDIVRENPPYSHCALCWKNPLGGRKYAPPWLWEYLARVQSAVSEQPCGDAALQPSRLSILVTAPCNHNEYSRSVSGLVSVSRALANEIDRVTREVPFCVLHSSIPTVHYVNTD